MIPSKYEDYKLDTTHYPTATAYNQGYQHGLEDTKKRALVRLWKSYLKYKDLDPDLAKLILDTIKDTEKLN